MAITIREYTPSDYDYLLILETDLIDAMAEMDPHKRFRSRKDFDAKKYFDALLKNIDANDGIIYVAEVDGNVAGYIMGKIEEFSDVDSQNKYPTVQGYIEGLFVDEKYRSKGISTQLIQSMEKYFLSKGCKHSSVACIAVNEAARRLYEKNGYGEQYIDYIKKL